MLSLDKTSHHTVTFKHAREIWAGSIASNEAIDIQKYMKQLQLSEELGMYGPSVMYLADFRTMTYLYMSQNIDRMTGYSVDKFMEGGAAFTFSLIHPEDRYAILHKVHKAQANFLQKMPPNQHLNYKFSYNYRFQRADGTYSHALKEDVVLQLDPQGNPLLMLGSVLDIGHLKKDHQITLVAHHFEKGSKATQTLYHSSVNFLSPRELDVLKLIIAGYTTEQIADKLFISCFTVKNHRRNMMGKTGTKKMAEVIRLALEKGIV